MTDLGSTVRLTAENADPDGNLVDPAAGPTLTVTLPDTTTVSPNVVEDGTGSWHADLVTTQAGRHVARWVGTGADAFAHVEAFTVDTTDDGMLFPLREAKRALGWAPDVPTGDDDEMRDFIASVTPIIEDLVGPILPRPMDEWYDGGGALIAVTTTPVLSVTTVTESWGGSSIRTLTNQPLDGVTPVSTYGYTVDLATGILTRRISGVASPFVGGRRNVHVMYVAGQPVKPNLRRAAKEQFRFMWNEMHEGNRPGFVPTPDVEYTPAGYLVPNHVSQLCLGDQRIPGIA